MRRAPTPPRLAFETSALSAALLAVALAAPMPAAHAAKASATAPIEGVVTRVIDGDTLLLQPAGQQAIDVRLRDIDAPEICQPWGVEARRALEEFTLGKRAELHPSGKDNWGRTVGALTVEGISIGSRMVEEGHAWSARTKWDRGPLVKQERAAKALGRGLHATAGAEMPKDFRARVGRCPKP